MSGIVEAVLKELDKYEVERVEEVFLTIGELTNLGSEQLTFAYDIITKGTILEGSSLIIDHESIQVVCGACGYRGGVDRLQNDEYHNSIPILSCPKCQKAVQIVAGKSCTVKSMNVVEK